MKRKMLIEEASIRVLTSLLVQGRVLQIGNGTLHTGTKRFTVQTDALIRNGHFNSGWCMVALTFGRLITRF